MGYGVHAYAVDFTELTEAAGPEPLEGYDLEKVVRRKGRMLDNGHWSAMRGSWFDVVDEGLAAAGSEAKLFRYFFGGSPVPTQPIDDFPVIGKVRPKDVEGLRASLEAALASGRLPPEVAPAVEQFRGWLDVAAEGGRGLVFFYY